ncbi:epididymal secretory protein 4-like isoform X1 [Crotalus tigris]|uniref:epididymal secretory protein 4-like isoform X1 n=2 Tax=Crotalus tigris TaxID=88082 RepID=UPI00192F6FB6|nr:epididymal secretory protein 4-like isoform X1 [Crotalus tigris]
MKILLGSLLLAGVCWLGDAVDIPVMPNFDIQRVAGNWYPLAYIVIEKPFPQYTLQAKPKGGLMYTFKSLENGQCKTRQLRFAKYQKLGKFKTSSPTFGQIVDTDYETYMIIYLTRGLDTFLTLEGRQQNITPDLETKFKNVAASVGITGEVVPVVLKETC